MLCTRCYRLPASSPWRRPPSPFITSSSTRLTGEDHAHGSSNNTASKLSRHLVNRLFEFHRPGRLHETNLNQLEALRQLVLHLDTNPAVSMETLQSGIAPSLLKLRNTGPVEVKKQANMALSLLGHSPSYRGRGLRILSIDGGGTRGLIPIILLQHLERVSGLKVHEMFDYVAGTSTGSLISTLVFVERAPIEEVEVLYRELSSKIFKMNNLLGIGQLFLTQSFYDSSLLERQVRKFLVTEKKMYETSSEPNVPKMSFVSTLVNQPIIEPFLFTNYRHHPGRPSHYLSMCNTTLWRAIMASTAAPGYFEEVKVGPYILQDGGILTNNPAAIALHEARHLWGSTVPIQCLISLGTGQFIYDKTGPVKTGKASSSSISLRDKLTKIVASATDTEAVHTILRDLLPPSSYFRFNPQLSELIALDNCNPNKLQALIEDTRKHIDTNGPLLNEAAKSLNRQKTFRQKLTEKYSRCQQWPPNQ